jgi:hypothetical protein
MGTRITHSSEPKNDKQIRLCVATTVEPRAEPVPRVRSRHLGLLGIGKPAH